MHLYRKLFFSILICRSVAGAAQPPIPEAEALRGLMSYAFRNRVDAHAAISGYQALNHVTCNYPILKNQALNMLKAIIDQKIAEGQCGLARRVPEVFRGGLLSSYTSRGVAFDMTNFMDEARTEALTYAETRIQHYYTLKRNEAIELAKEAKQLDEPEKRTSAYAIADSFPDAQKDVLRAAIDAAYGDAIPRIENTVPQDQAYRVALLRGLAQRTVNGN